MSLFGLKFSQMILHTETSKLIYNWSFLFEVLHKPTLLTNTFNLLKFWMSLVPCFIAYWIFKMFRPRGLLIFVCGPNGTNAPIYQPPNPPPPTKKKKKKKKTHKQKPKTKQLNAPKHSSHSQIVLSGTWRNEVQLTLGQIHKSNNTLSQKLIMQVIFSLFLKILFLTPHIKLHQFILVMTVLFWFVGTTVQYTLDPSMPDDRLIREHLQRRQLSAVLAVQQGEREDLSLSRSCLFCRDTFTGNRAELFNHMAFSHSFNVGQPDNIGRPTP